MLFSGQREQVSRAESDTGLYSDAALARPTEAGKARPNQDYCLPRRVAAPRTVLLSAQFDF